MQAFQKEIQLFEKLNAQVLGVSTDSLATHEEFSGKHGLSFPLVADENGELQKLYAPGRVTFLIDQAGTIRQILKGTPDTALLLQEISMLQDRPRRPDRDKD